MARPKGLALLTTAHGVNDFYQGAVPAVLPFLIAERHYSYALIAGITLAATGLSSVVQPLFGLAADRWRAGWLVAAGFLTGAIGLAISGFTGSYLWTFVAIMISGIGTAGFHPVAAKAAREAGGASTKAMSVFSVGGTVGVAVAPLIVAGVLHQTGMQGAWLLMFPAVVMAIVCALRFRPSHNRSLAAAARAVAARVDDWAAFGRLSLVAVFWSVGYAVVVSFVALYMITRFGISTSTGAATLTAFTAGGVLGTLTGGFLSDRRGRLWTIRFGYLVSVPAAAGMVLVPNIAGSLACTLVLGTAMFVPFAAQITLAQDYLPRHVGLASGLTLGLTLSMGGLLSPVFGVIADAWGVRTVLTCVIGVIAVGAVLTLLLTEPAPAPAVAEEEPATA